mmetsp:Transcript_21611/g.46978  ORF Transcript_21611/g.46978 Transcript_21611/m.46978 type:complete len:251 (+) Transcript_21611:1714-2466(+)
MLFIYETSTPSHNYSCAYTLEDLISVAEKTRLLCCSLILNLLISFSNETFLVSSTVALSFHSVISLFNALFSIFNLLESVPASSATSSTLLSMANGLCGTFSGGGAFSLATVFSILTVFKSVAAFPAALFTSLMLAGGFVEAYAAAGASLFIACSSPSSFTLLESVAVFLATSFDSRSFARGFDGALASASASLLVTWSSGSSPSTMFSIFAFLQPVAACSDASSLSSADRFDELLSSSSSELEQRSIGS